MAKLNRLKAQGQRIRVSKREKEVYDLLTQMWPAMKFFSEYPYSAFTDTDNNHLRADIYCKTYNIVWEIQGEAHDTPIIFGHSEEEIQDGIKKLAEQKERDALKRMLCEDAGVKFIEIWYDKWDKLKNKEEKREYLMELL